MFGDCNECVRLQVEETEEKYLCHTFTFSLVKGIFEIMTLETICNSFKDVCV